MSSRLLLVDNDAALAETLSAELADFGHGVTIARNGPDALRLATEEQFNVILLDRVLPEIDGLTVLRRLRQQRVQTPVIIVTTLDRLAEKIEGLESGADDYLIKPVAAAELNARIAVVQRRRLPATDDSDTVRAGDIVVSPAKHRAWRGGVPIDLRKLELKLLAELVRHAGSVMTRATLAQRVWAYQAPPTTNVVDSYVARLRAKLMASGGDDPIVTVRGVGYLLRD